MWIAEDLAHLGASSLLVNAQICSLAHIFISVTHQNMEHYERDQAERNTGKVNFQFLRLVIIYFHLTTHYM